MPVLGSVVVYRRPEAHVADGDPALYAAMVTRVHEGGEVDLVVFPPGKGAGEFVGPVAEGDDPGMFGPVDRDRQPVEHDEPPAPPLALSPPPPPPSSDDHAGDDHPGDHQG